MVGYLFDPVCVVGCRTVEKRVVLLPSNRSVDAGVRSTKGIVARDGPLGLPSR